jgi:hypothetical protein
MDGTRLMRKSQKKAVNESVSAIYRKPTIWLRYKDRTVNDRAFKGTQSF